jgi:6-pyruvoyltetrahydropterin/6-carboxytetrahydropterin synthase
MTLLHLTAATGRFAAARQVHGLPPGHPCRGLHGHNFQASAWAALPPGFAAYPGGEIGALAARLESCLRPLQHAHLNERMSEPTDTAIAAWIAQSIELPCLARIALQSTPEQGVERDGAGRSFAWRRYRFEAAHWLPKVAPGHKCGRMHGHGFEVVIHVRAAPGAASPGTEYELLDQAWAPWRDRLDCRCLNEIEGLDNPTSEMLSSWLWTRLRPALPGLAWVGVFETPSCGASFDGQRYRIWKELALDSAVRHLHAPAHSPRHRVHGHTFKLRLNLSAPLDAVLGWTIDFGDVKQVFDPTFDRLDHRPLYEIAGLGDTDTASLALWIFHTARRDLPQLVGVELFEAEGRGACVSADAAAPPLPV